MSAPRAIQDFYSEASAICFGCGRNNPQGLGVRTFWDGTEGVCHITPAAWHTAFPGVVYGGLLASLIDCHSIGTAIAALYDAAGRAPGSAPEITCVTASLQVDFLRPTPTGARLALRAQPVETGARKVVVRCSLRAGGQERARGRVVAVRVPSRGGAGHVVD